MDGIEFWLDSALADEKSQILWQSAKDAGIATGVTVNPTIIRNACDANEKTLTTIILELIAQVPAPYLLAIQVTDDDNNVNNMFERAKRLRALCDRIIIKVVTGPLDVGLTLMHKLAKEGIPFLATDISDASQISMAMKLGAKYIAPYLNAMEENNIKAFDVLRQMVATKNEHKSDIKVMVASIPENDKGKQMITDAFSIGANAVTAPPIAFEKYFELNKLAKKYDEQFTKDGKECMAKDVGGIFDLSVKFEPSEKKEERSQKKQRRTSFLGSVYAAPSSPYSSPMSTPAVTSPMTTSTTISITEMEVGSRSPSPTPGGGGSQG